MREILLPLFSIPSIRTEPSGIPGSLFTPSLISPGASSRHHPSNGSSWVLESISFFLVLSPPPLLFGSVHLSHAKSLLLFPAPVLGSEGGATRPATATERKHLCCASLLHTHSHRTLNFFSSANPGRGLGFGFGFGFGSLIPRCLFSFLSCLSSARTNPCGCGCGGYIVSLRRWCCGDGVVPTRRVAVR